MITIDNSKYTHTTQYIEDDQVEYSIIKLIFNYLFYFILSLLFFINQNKINEFKNILSQIGTAIVVLYIFFKKE